MELIFIPSMPQQIQCAFPNLPWVHKVKMLFKIIKIKLQIKIKTRALVSVIKTLWGQVILKMLKYAYSIKSRDIYNYMCNTAYFIWRIYMFDEHDEHSYAHCKHQIKQMT